MTTSTSTFTSHDTFHLFPYLPWELRARVWEMTVSPRTVLVKCRNRPISPSTFSLDIRRRLDRDYDRFRERPIFIRLLYTSSPIPAALHACQEARNHLTHPACCVNGYGYYEKMSSSDLKNRQRPWLWEEKIRSPYIWVNYEVDTVDFGSRDFSFSRNSDHVSKFKRIKLTPIPPSMAFKVLTPGGYTSFPNVKEAEIEIPGGGSVAV